MPIKRYKPGQIEVSIVNGKATPQACREAEITIQTFYAGGRNMAVRRWTRRSG